MKVYRGFDKEIGPISYPYWTYVTPDIEQAKWYATKDGDVKDGAIIEWDLDVDNLRFISLDKLNSFAQSKSEIYSEEDLLWYQEGLGEDLEAYIDGIVFKDPYSKRDHTIYIVFRKDDLKNGRILSPEEFNRVQLRETDEQINDILNRAGVQLNEEEVKPFIWTDPSYSQFHKILRNNTTYGKLSAIIDGNHIFCWDSAIKHHDSIIEQIENSGINVSDDAIWVRFKEPNICWVSAAYFDDYTDEELDDLPQQDFELELENNPVIRRYFPNGVKIERFNNLINESIDNNLITLYRGFDTRYGNFGSPNSFIWATDDIDIAKMYVDKNETSALLKFQLDPNKLNEISEWNSDFQDFINEYGIYDGIDFDEECADWCRSKGYNCFIHGSDNEYWIILDSNLILNPEIIK